MNWKFWSSRNVAISTMSSAVCADVKVRGTAASCERIVSRTVSALDFEVRVNDTWVTGNDALDKLFARPFTEAMAYTASSLSSFGRAILRFEEGRFSTCDPLAITITYENNGRIVEVRDTLTNTPIPSYVFVCVSAPGWPIGRGALDEVPDAIDAEQSAYKGASDILNNKTVFGALVSVPGGMGQKALDEIADKLTKAYSGEGRGRVIAIGADAKVEQLDVRLDGVLPVETASATKRVIASAYGVPYDMIDTEDSNKASVVDASSRYMKFTIYPLAWLICDAMTRSGYLHHFGISGIRPKVANTTGEQNVQAE